MSLYREKGLCKGGGSIDLMEDNRKPEIEIDEQEKDKREKKTNQGNELTRMKGNEN